MKEYVLLFSGTYFVGQAAMCAPWVASVWYTDKLLSRLQGMVKGEEVS